MTLPPVRVATRSQAFWALFTIVSMGLAEREITKMAAMVALDGLIPDQDAMSPAVGELAGRSLIFYASAGVAVVSAHIGTMLYACMIYAAVVWVRPRVQTRWAACWAVAVCFAVETFQLTGIPADLAWHSWLLAQALGSRFDWLDMAAYLAGAVCVAALHWVWTRGVAPPTRPKLTFDQRVEHLKEGCLPTIVKE